MPTALDPRLRGDDGGVWGERGKLYAGECPVYDGFLGGDLGVDGDLQGFAGGVGVAAGGIDAFLQSEEAALAGKFPALPRGSKGVRVNCNFHPAPSFLFKNKTTAFILKPFTAE